MSINVLARKLLWGRAGNRCAFPECNQALTIDMGTEDSDILSSVGVVMGEEAHIRSAKLDGPRHEPQYDKEKLDTYENLLLLCPTHHTLIDKNNGAGFSIGKLQNIKQAHEKEVSEKLSTDAASRRELSERMLALLLAWEQKMHLDLWENTTAGLNQAIPRISASTYDRLIETGSWLLRMRWPSEFPRTVQALRNLHRIFADLLYQLQECMASETGKSWILRREYKKIDWNPEAYERLFAKFQTERLEIYILVIEATKAINWVITEAASEVDQFYRFDQGVVLMREGDGILDNIIIRIEYENDETEGDSPAPYPGLEAIREHLQARISQNAHHFDGHGLANIVREIRAGGTTS